MHTWVSRSGGIRKPGVAIIAFKNAIFRLAPNAATSPVDCISTPSATREPPSLLKLNIGTFTPTRV